jgi:hypothetical protein
LTRRKKRRPHRIERGRRVERAEIREVVRWRKIHHRERSAVRRSVSASLSSAGLAIASSTSCFPGRGGVLLSSGVSRAFIGTDGRVRHTRPWSRRGSSVGDGGGRQDKSISKGSFLIVILSVFLRLLDFETRGLGRTTSRGGVKRSCGGS